MVNGRPLDYSTNVGSWNEFSEASIPQMNHWSNEEKSQYTKSTRPVPIGIKIPRFNLDDRVRSVLLVLSLFRWSCRFSLLDQLLLSGKMVSMDEILAQ